jgi:hypothetical protein
MLAEKAATQTEQRPSTLERVAVLRPPGCRLAVGARRLVQVTGCFGDDGLRGEAGVMVACRW